MKDRLTLFELELRSGYPRGGKVHLRSTRALIGISELKATLESDRRGA
jgi:hypothetical protein